jgi:ectoine hydroxylase-related dioxygenase (phytanoyl-CoA dioxygenase family)
MNSRLTSNFDAAPKVSVDGLPELGELKVHNHLLGDHSALDVAWKSDGYWFFKDVLDKAAVGRLRDEYVRELEGQAVIEPSGATSTERSVVYNGNSLEKFPFRMEPLAARAPWRAFAADPAIHAFFTRLLGNEPFWVPIAEYRATPPATDPHKRRLDYVHQDGPYSPGIDFRILWIPLAEIDRDTGGLILAEGLTEQVNRHRIASDGTNHEIPVEDLPANSWRHTTYQAGDVLLMNLWTPHTGLSNVSNRFRLSLDLRIMSTADRCPAIGEIKAISPSSLVMDVNGQSLSLRILPDTYVRNHMGQKLSPAATVEYFTPGSTAIVGHSDGVATVVRPPH